MKTSNKNAADHHAARRRWLNSHEEGYHKAMGNRQVQMIAIGGAIGTGLFLGAGARLQMAGPALALVYLVCGIFSFFILRALGELDAYQYRRLHALYKRDSIIAYLNLRIADLEAALEAANARIRELEEEYHAGSTL